MRPKPTNVACPVRPARRQQARTPNSATTSASPRTCSALSSSRSAGKESPQCLPSTGPARAMITPWKNVSPIRKRCRARHTLSGRDPPEGTSDHMRFTRTAAVVRQARRVMGGKRAKAMPMLLKSKNRGVVALRGVPGPRLSAISCRLRGTALANCPDAIFQKGRVRVLCILGCPGDGAGPGRRREDVMRDGQKYLPEPHEARRPKCACESENLGQNALRFYDLKAPLSR